MGTEIDLELRRYGQEKNRMIIFDGMYEVVMENEKFVAKSLYNKMKEHIKLERVTWFSGRSMKPVKDSELIEAFAEEKQQ